MPRAPTLTALLTRSERVILFSGVEVIVLIPFRGELGLGSAQAEQVELVDADDDGDQGDAQDGHVGVGAQQEAQEVEGHKLLGEHQAAEHGEAHGRQDVGCNAKASKDKGRDEVEHALDGVSTQIERQRAQQERHDDTGQTDQEVHRIDTLKVALAGEDISAVNQDRQDGVEDVLDGKAQRGDGHSERDGCLGALAQLDSEGAGEHAADRLIRRHVGADGDRAHEQQLQAGADREAGLQVPQHQAHERAQDDGAERIERTELEVELTKCGDKSDEDCLDKHNSSQ